MQQPQESTCHTLRGLHLASRHQTSRGLKRMAKRGQMFEGFGAFGPLRRVGAPKCRPGCIRGICRPCTMQCTSEGSWPCQRASGQSREACTLFESQVHMAGPVPAAQHDSRTLWNVVASPTRDAVPCPALVEHYPTMLGSAHLPFVSALLSIPGRPRCLRGAQTPSVSSQEASSMCSQIARAVYSLGKLPHSDAACWFATNKRDVDNLANSNPRHSLLPSPAH
ncbi:hypothetical protein BKA66DRAFT_553417 [Pyrenochaeta sp. MPI-SDFR-AT-0127]|nr:hypothetical protein BKA66DRAFT_553417 [Pyrenochaeta sp. MPI-SDFR-AT-0127]